MPIVDSSHGTSRVASTWVASTAAVWSAMPITNSGMIQSTGLR